jgi:hypothetical protein
MRFQLKPDSDVRVQQLRIGRIPTLVLKPAKVAEVPVSVLEKQGALCYTAFTNQISVIGGQYAVA